MLAVNRLALLMPASNAKRSFCCNSIPLVVSCCAYCAPCNGRLYTKRYAHSRRYICSAASPTSDALHPADDADLIKHKYKPLKEALDSLMKRPPRRSLTGTMQLRLSILSPPSDTLLTLLRAALAKDGMTINLLPLDYSLLTSRLSRDERLSSYKKHVTDNWRSLIMEAGSDIVLTTSEYHSLIAPICRGLTLPVYVLTDMPTLLDDEDYESAVKAVHGYLQLLNKRWGNDDTDLAPLLSGILDTVKLHIFSEIGSCRSKAVMHTVETLNAEVERFGHFIRLQKGDHIINCLLPHEYAYIVYGIIYAHNVGATIHQPIRIVNMNDYKGLKMQFPLTTQRDVPEAIIMTQGMSVFDYVRKKALEPKVLLCNSQTLRMLLSFVTCDDLSQRERLAYTSPWRSLRQIVVFDDISQLNNMDLEGDLARFKQAACLDAHGIQVWTLPEAGAVGYRDFDLSHSQITVLPGCKIKDRADSFMVTVSSGSLFKAYHKRDRASSEALTDGTLRLLENHADYVAYFKRRKERMARFPQGFVKRVPVRTQFWGNFTGKNKHHSVL